MKKVWYALLLTVSSLTLISCSRRHGETDMRSDLKKPDNELYTAIVYNNIPLIKKAVKDGADINKIQADLGDGSKQSPLLLAYNTHANETVIQTLKQMGAQADAEIIKNSDWWMAASNAQDRVLEEMIKGGFDMYTKNTMQMTAYSAIVTGNNPDYDMSRALNVMHKYNYKPTYADLKLCRYNNNHFTASNCVKTIRCLAEKLKSIKKEEWLGRQLVDECTGGNMKQYTEFNITDLYCIAAFSDSGSLEYAMKSAEEDVDRSLLTAVAIRCNNVENYRYLTESEVMQDSGAVYEYENSIYECMAAGYDDILKELAGDIGPDHARIALALSQYFADEKYFAAYIEKYGLSETDQRNLILTIHTAEEAEWLPVVIKYGYQVDFLNGQAVRAPGTFTYLECGGNKKEALEGCWNCRECYGDPDFLEKLVKDYHVDLTDKLSGMLELAVSGGYTKAAKWLLEYGAEINDKNREMQKAPYLIYNSDEMLKLLEERGLTESEIA